MIKGFTTKQSAIALDLGGPLTHADAEGCLFLSLGALMEGGVSLRGDDGVFLLEGVMKCEKISVC